jgi:hypothetical protein
LELPSWQAAQRWIQANIIESRFFPDGKLLGCSLFQPARCQPLRTLPASISGEARAFASQLANLVVAYARTASSQINDATTQGMLELVVIDHIEDLIASLLSPDVVCVYLQCLAHDGWGRT